MEGTPQRRFAVGSDASASSPAAMPAGSRNCGRIQTEISMTISMTPMISAVAPPRVLMEMTRSPRCNVAYVGTRMTKPDPMRNLLAQNGLVRRQCPNCCPIGARGSDSSSTWHARRWPW
jgi:hypothetical protein